jgi:recombination protein RecA
MPNDAIVEICNAIKGKLDDPSVIYSVGTEVENFEAISTGIPVVDECLSGGIPKGRIVEIFGPESSGKTTLMLHLAASAQNAGCLVYYVDAEHAIDFAYARRIGVNTGRMLFSQPDYGEQAFEVIRCGCEAVREWQQSTKQTKQLLVIVDSIPGLVPRSEFIATEKDGIDTSSGFGTGRARMFANFLPKIIGPAADIKATIVFINQERDKVGVTFGSPISQPGGRAMKFFASVRLRIQYIGKYESGGKQVGIKSRLSVIKSKVFPPFGRQAEFIITGDGIDIMQSFVDQCFEHGVIVKKGSWSSFGDVKYQGTNAWSEKLKQDSELFNLMQKVMAEKLNARD